MRTIHPQVQIRHGKVTANVDKAIFPLIVELWKAGWETIRSCQRQTATKMAWIEFDQALYVEAFLNVVAPYDPAPDSIWRRSKAWGFGEFGPTSELFQGDLTEQERKGAWTYHVSVTDGSHCDATGERGAGGPAFALSINVLFPQRDLATLVARVRQYNRKTVRRKK